MAKLGKLDLACVGFMAVIILIGSGYLAVFAGWMLVGPTLVWIGWVWWVVFTLVIIALLILVWTSRRQMS